MKRFFIASVAVIGMLLVGGNTSEAGGIRLSFGTGRGYHGGYGHHGYGYRSRGFNRYPTYRAPRWHDTSHYDYHPGGYVPHGNHLHYVPGHYDFHQTGHFHY